MPESRLITVGDTSNPFSAAKMKIVSGSDASILVCTDSNGNETTEFVYVFAQILAALYPTHSVIYTRWTSGGSTWEAPVTISTGSTSAAINIWNCANPGTRPDFILGGRYFLSHRITGPDAIVLCHGGNMISGANETAIAGMFFEYLGKVAETFPSAGMVVVKSQPERDNNNRDILFSAFDRVFSQAPCLILDVNAVIVGLGKAAYLFQEDGVHLSEAGQAVGHIALIEQAWNRATPGINAPGPQFTQVWSENLINNGNFSEFASSTPSCTNGTFGARGSAVIGKSTSIYHPRNPNKYSLTVTGDGSTASPALRWAPDSATLNALKGKMVTFAARVYVPEGISGDTSRARITVQQSTGTVSSIPRETDQGEWVWRVISGVKINAATSYLQLYVTADDGGAADRITYIDQIILTAGGYPGCNW